VPTEREVSLPVTLPASDAGARPAELAEFAVARRETAALLERQADDIATRWEVQVRALLPEATGEDVTSWRGLPQTSPCVSDRGSSTDFLD
jgi:hypothetical protein